MKTGRGGLLALAAALLLGGCGGGSGWEGTDADVAILMMGNSHTSYNRLPVMVEDMVAAGSPGQTAGTVVAPDWGFLEDHFNNATTLQLVRLQDWSFMVLQAQKYSSSGCCVYSTEEAKALIRMAREQNAVPILFPEWPRLGVDETLTIYNLHVSIAQAEPACVAPVGQAWDLALERNPELVLHATDGNHSAPAGALLTALVLSATMTGASPLGMPALAGFGVDADTQALLRAAAADTVAAWPPRQHCPDDPYPAASF